ncbi:hypothetical protein ABMA32_08365 [Mesorhizobium sp. VNQ89]|uniref:hypothetical protein n=1 Tax=Mesorhizobium quangtriensis TaxID=3157709 RepID=UPI0032B7422B
MAVAAADNHDLQERASAAAENFANAVLSVAVAAVITAVPVFAHIIHPALGIVSAALLAGLCAWRMPQIAIVVIFFAFLFQNTFVSLAVNSVTSDDEFDIIRGYNFVTLAVVWLVLTAGFLLDWNRRNRAADPFVKMLVGVYAILGIYFLLGFALYGMTAIIYLRNIVTPFLLFQICMIAFLRQPVRLGQALTILSVLLVICGFAEFFWRETWLDLTNGYAFWERAAGPNYITMAYDKKFAETGIVATGFLDNIRITLFNSPLFADYEIQVMRLFGPNMHAISFAYALCFLAVFALYRGRFVISVALLALLVLTSAKGPLILFLLVAVAWMLFRLFGAVFAFACLGLALAVYAVAGIKFGLDIGDYHAIGFMGGVHEFLTNPIGRGIGAGGNLSSEFTSIDWPAAQAAGRTPFAVESAVGVLMSQIGVFAFVVIGAYVWIAWRVLRIARETGNDLHAAAAFALAAIVVTGLFQEEAYFAPLALAVFMALAGMIVGAAGRAGLLDQHARPPTLS